MGIKMQLKLPEGRKGRKWSKSHSRPKVGKVNRIYICGDLLTHPLRSVAVEGQKVLTRHKPHRRDSGNPLAKDCQSFILT